MNEATLTFLRQHAADDPFRLLLQQKRYPEVDMHFVVQQIEGRQQALAKWPTLAACCNYWFPPKLNREQSSSEVTARHKAQLFAKEGMRVADLTGGMGVDCMAMAAAGAVVDYCEMEQGLSLLMQHNCEAMGVNNISCHTVDSMEWLAAQEDDYDLLLIDPARRNAAGQRVAAFEDCTPNLLEHLGMLLSHCHSMVVKASPMIDITAAIQQLGCVCEVHIVSLNGECKEVLFVCNGTMGVDKHTAEEWAIEDVAAQHLEVEVSAVKEPLFCCHLLGNRQGCLSFRPDEEECAVVQYCTAVGNYLYDPDAALMKGGAFRLIGQRYGIEKVGRNSHLYTADHCVEQFLGRIFRVVAPISLNKKALAKAIPTRKAHVITANYPTPAATLQKQLGLREGGNQYIIATTVGSKPQGYLCERVQ